MNLHYFDVGPPPSPLPQVTPTESKPKFEHNLRPLSPVNRKKKTPTQLRRERKKRQKERERRQNELEQKIRDDTLKIHVSSKSCDTKSESCDSKSPDIPSTTDKSSNGSEVDEDGKIWNHAHLGDKIKGQTVGDSKAKPTEEIKQESINQNASSEQVVDTPSESKAEDVKVELSNVPLIEAPPPASMTVNQPCPNDVTEHVTSSSDALTLSITSCSVPSLKQLAEAVTGEEIVTADLVTNEEPVVSSNTEADQCKGNCEIDSYQLVEIDQATPQIEQSDLTSESTTRNEQSTSTFSRIEKSTSSSEIEKSTSSSEIEKSTSSSEIEKSTSSSEIEQSTSSSEIEQSTSSSEIEKSASSSEIEKSTSSSEIEKSASSSEIEKSTSSSEIEQSTSSSEIEQSTSSSEIEKSASSSEIEQSTSSSEIEKSASSSEIEQSTSSSEIVQSTSSSEIEQSNSSSEIEKSTSSSEIEQSNSSSEIEKSTSSPEIQFTAAESSELTSINDTISNSEENKKPSAIIQKQTPTLATIDDAMIEPACMLVKSHDIETTPPTSEHLHTETSKHEIVEVPMDTPRLLTNQREE